MNLKDQAERERLRKLIVERADVVIQNLRPGSAEEFGLDARDAARAQAFAHLLHDRRVRRAWARSRIAPATIR